LDPRTFQSVALPFPGVPLMSQSDPSAMVRFNCPKCDRQMQARAEYAGRTTRCPGCQHQLPIPAPGAAATAPAPRGGGRGGLGAGVVIGALLLVLAGALAAWKFWPRGGAGGPGYVREEVDDRDLLPATAQALATLRLAELWQRPAVQKALEDLRKSEP